MSRSLKCNHLCIHLISLEHSTSFYMYLYQHPLLQVALFWKRWQRKSKPSVFPPFFHVLKCLVIWSSTRCFKKASFSASYRLHTGRHNLQLLLHYFLYTLKHHWCTQACEYVVNLCSGIVHVEIHHSVRYNTKRIMMILSNRINEYMNLL